MYFQILIQICLCGVVFFSQPVSAQQKTANITLIGYGDPYKVIDNKIYKDTIENSSKLIATIVGKIIYKDSSQKKKDILYTIVGRKVYTKNIINDKGLLFYTEGNKIFLRLKKGGFAPAGTFDPKNFESLIFLYLDPLEYLALMIACNY